MLKITIAVEAVNDQQKKVKKAEPEWQLLDLEAEIKRQLDEIHEKAEKDAVERMNLRSELRWLGR